MIEFGFWIWFLIQFCVSMAGGLIVYYTQKHFSPQDAAHELRVWLVISVALAFMFATAIYLNT